MLQTAGHLLLTAWVAVTAVTVTGLACVSILGVAIRNPRSPIMDRIMVRWARTVLKLTRSTIERRGAEDLDTSRPYVVVSNHRSDLDIPVNVVAVDLPIRFMAKKELFDVPVFGQTLRALGMIEVNRQRGAAAHLEVNEAAEAISGERYSIMVYPEGTRSRSGQMLPFKKGAFAVAIDRDMPILPVTIFGTDRVWKAGGLVRGGHVIIEVGEPILTETLTRQDIGDLSERTRQVVETTYARLASS